jgi:hypothetical protein
VQHKIFVTAQGGIAEVCGDTVPSGIVVEVLDFDNLETDPAKEMSHWSPELREYWQSNHKDWDSCGTNCPCGCAR